MRHSQADHFRSLKARPKVAQPETSEPSVIDHPEFGPLIAACLYTPTTLRQAMGIGRRYYDTLIKAGMPHSTICGRIWLSGSLVIQWVESQTTEPSTP